MTTLEHALPGTALTAAPRAWWPARVVAVLLDGAVLGALAWVVLGTDQAAPRLWPGIGTPLAADVPPWNSSGVLVGAVAALAASQAWTGATPGKRAVGIVVVDAVTGRPVGLARTLLRQLAHVLDAFLYLGYLRAGLDVHGRTFADQLVGTRALTARRPPGWAPTARPPWVGRALTAGAVVLVTLGVAGSVPVESSGGSARTLAQDCALVEGTGVRAEVLRDVVWSRERRFGSWVRERTEPAPVVVRWIEVGTPAPARPTEVHVVAADPRDGSGWTTAGVPEVDDGPGTWSLTLRADDLRGMERVELWATLRSAVGDMATCRTVVDLRGTDAVPR